MTRLFPLLLAALLAPGAAFGLSIMKCVGPDGTVVMSDPPCPAGFAAQVQRLKPNVLQSDGLRQWADKNPEPPAPAATSGGSRGQSMPSATPAVAAPPAFDTADCENARRAYQFEAGFRFRKADVLQAKRRDMELSCGDR